MRINKIHENKITFFSKLELFLLNYMNHLDGIFAYKCSTFILNIKCKSFKSNLIKNQYYICW